jgi:hypothetical protein
MTTSGVEVEMGVRDRGVLVAGAVDGVGEGGSVGGGDVGVGVAEGVSVNVDSVGDAVRVAVEVAATLVGVAVISATTGVSWPGKSCIARKMAATTVSNTMSKVPMAMATR